MEEFLRGYGLWILLGVIFLAIYRFGGGCGGHRHGTDPAERTGHETEPKSVSRSRPAGGCH